MAYDPNCAAYWCDKCGKELTVAFQDCCEEALVLKCQGNPLNREAGCGTTRSFLKMPDEPFFEQLDKIDAIVDEANDEIDVMVNKIFSGEVNDE